MNPLIHDNHHGDQAILFCHLGLSQSSRVGKACRLALHECKHHLPKYTRKRARGIKDTEYFKLKIRQSSLADNDSLFYA